MRREEERLEEKRRGQERAWEAIRRGNAARQEEARQEQLEAVRRREAEEEQQLEALRRQEVLAQQIVIRKPLGDCPSCFEPNLREEDAESCRRQCGQNTCKGCFRQWRRAQRGQVLRCCVW